MADLSSLNITAQDNSAPAYTVLPKGYYQAVALKEEMKDTKDGTGKYIAMEFEVSDTKRKIFQNYNIVNKNPKAQEIAVKELQSFAWAIGLQSLGNSEQLLYKNVQVYVDIEAGKDGYKDKNVIKGYYPTNWTVEQIEAHRGSKKASEPVAQPAQPTVGSSPWARK